jgi:hypothetical protein
VQIPTSIVVILLNFFIALPPRMFRKIRDGRARMTSATDELSVSEAGLQQ